MSVRKRAAAADLQQHAGHSGDLWPNALPTRWPLARPLDGALPAASRHELLPYGPGRKSLHGSVRVAPSMRVSERGRVIARWLLLPAIATLNSPPVSADPEDNSFF